MTHWPVVDLFAGPGGLGEGFATFSSNGRSPFRLALSIEMEASAHRTLSLRALFRRLEDRRPYYDYARATDEQRDAMWDRLIRTHHLEARQAADEAWLAALGIADPEAVHARITRAKGRSDRWVLIGGPPCQAYSLVGRSRMRRVRGAEFDLDSRHLLYQEYLKIVARHAPPIFVMENVKGILSSKHNGGPIFERIRRDLEFPRVAVGMGDRGLRYTILGLSSPSHGTSFVIRSEEHGIPQARHRVILLGVRADLSTRPVALGKSIASLVTLEDVVGDLPQIRSGLTKEPDTHAHWLSALREGAQLIRASSSNSAARAVARAAEVAASGARDVTARGSSFTPYTGEPSEHRGWYIDRELGGLVGHRARRHMRSDLWRYLFAASYAQATGRSPTLLDFPESLQPAHRNAQTPSPIFGDRFRVQIPDRPASTITSHIAKDGNYYIHYDAMQCRSFTMREAARAQTFPDNYLFLGGATQQFHQIGNAVPPLLAQRIASVVARILR